LAGFIPHPLYFILASLAVFVIRGYDDGSHELECQLGPSSLIWIFFFSNLARGAPYSSYGFYDHSLLFFTSGEQKA